MSMLGAGMQDPTHDNRRRWSRIALEMRVELYAGKREPRLYGRAVDLSEGGLSILTVDDLRIGEQLPIAFTIPQTNERFQFESVVRTKEGYKYGLEFLNVKQEERRELAEFGRVMKLLSEE
jgi:c-di-GMP-binding flagellar brake protein YcgR